MWNETAVARRLGIRYPIIQGPFGGGLSSTRLASAVSNNGGLGSYGADSLTPVEIRDLAAEMRALTSRPFAINLWIPKEQVIPPMAAQFDRYISFLEPYYRELGISTPIHPSSFGQNYEAQVDAILAAKPPVFSFVYGIPDAWIIRECTNRGILTVGTATTPEEAEKLDGAGVDCIVASGFEAGGHKGAFLKEPENSLIGLFSLIPRVVDRVKAPVIAAGGIADGRGIKAALALGAQAVQIGTAFLACEESGASQAYRERLFSEARNDTVLTRVFSGRLARSMRNRYSDEMQVHEKEVPQYPVQSWFTGTLKAAAISQGRTDLMSLWTGQSAGLVKHKNAKALIDDLVRQMGSGVGRDSSGQSDQRDLVTPVARRSPWL